ncbi:calpain family cysteine protease, putative [Entamoeba histolytica HM-1:IMSS-B]|uniref:Calpain family cysteine protease, putative n=4 Tax=Entamoeba histolytica TaxID=5759 RepID=C4LTE2_ENTH1|nr:calpain family cysteine protease, putative [Entamoeba histolytica HM-1:IMSS]EAL51933.1 calpain family cysteine protease, putative [Entamoeba histolytica HM-1:IMSS]EMH77873.1 calpain family cysteine protease, putative [Entamoeba histolytica HM-1:IMSS-B]ENY65635.1 calpain family cysteine protease, putative [Entamoeba histolytica HM-1:IMSS-A]GAT91826.1 calpain family cysteine protease putative [Entamoeba histolytica]|eukprot:XP_657312.1 calpain family cysteine protease, putative [Entamoeba histolytica HM-1:IMSS]
MFTDDEFPAELRSIGKIDSILPSSLTFLRPNEYMEHPQLYENGIEPLDIQQGCLGDCYFLAALASLSEFPERIKTMIKSCGNGKYEITLFYMGKERHIVIDDLIPCNNGQPFFSHNNGDELWVMLLEKAYAKVVGSYGEIEGGIPFLALSDLTGMPVKRISTRETDVNRLFKKIADYDKKKYCMVANVPDTPGIDIEKEYGLVENHAYTLIGAYEVDGIKLLKIRNPWGCCEWKGKWRDDDPAWTESMKKKLEVVEVNDGIYFMEIGDFVKFFDELTVVFYKKDWDCFNSVDVEMTDKQMAINFEGKGECIVSISQPRCDNKIAFRMWGIDDNEQPIGGDSGETFVISSNLCGKKMKLGSGNHRMIVETHQSCVSKLPFKFTLSFRSGNNIKIGAVVGIPATEKINYITKEASKNAEKCKACGALLPAKGIAKTKIGSFHLKCFKCDNCGKQLGGKFGLKGQKKLCPDCVAKK